MAILFVVAFIILTGLCSAIWINRAGENTIGIFCKAVLAPLVVAAALLAYDFFSPLPNVTRRIPVVVMRQGLSIVRLYELTQQPSDWSSSGYGFMRETSGLWAQTASPELRSAAATNRTWGTDVLECAIWSWLGNVYCNHWDIETFEFQGINSPTRKAYVPSPETNSKVKPYRYSTENLRRLLADNFLAATGPFDVRNLSPHLPPGSKVVRSGPSWRRKTTITTRRLTLSFSLSNAGGEGVGFSESWRTQIQTDWATSPLQKRIVEKFSPPNDFQTDLLK